MRVFAVHVCRVAVNQVLMSGHRHWAVARLYPVLFVEVSLSERLSCLLMHRSCSITSLIGSPSDLLPEMLVLQPAQLSHASVMLLLYAHKYLHIRRRSAGTFLSHLILISLFHLSPRSQHRAGISHSPPHILFRLVASRIVCQSAGAALLLPTSSSG